LTNGTFMELKSNMNSIVVIDDDKSLRQMIRDFLELENYTVILAENALDGLKIIDRYMPDLIICDVMMPQMNGFELKQALTENAETKIIPFIFLTSQTERENMRTGMQLGADDYLFKPVIADELLKAVKTQFEKRKELVKSYQKEKREEKDQKNEFDGHILVKHKGVPKFVKISSIVHIAADEKYTRLNLDEGEKIYTTKSLNEWEKILPAEKFVRVHRSNIINIEFVLKTEKWFNRNYLIKLKNCDDQIIISRRYYSKVREHFVS